MSVRGTSSAVAEVCPFVAFEDERDERSTRPDHRHRCYAELRPAPRALAHQEAYCLSPSFAACPTFQDWARREAARARPTARATDTSMDAPLAYDAGYGRRQSDWTAPPPWTGADAAGGGTGRDGAASSVPSDAGGDSHASTATGRGQPAGAGGSAAAGSAAAGSAAAGVGSAAAGAGSAAAGNATAGKSASEGTSGAAAPGFLTTRDRAPAGEGAGLAASAALAAAGPPSDLDDEDEFGPSPSSVGAAGSSASRGSTGSSGAAAGRSRAESDTSAAARAVRGPSWEQPRRYEAYPTLRTRVGLPAIPRVALGFVALLVAALALFVLPTLVLRPGGGGTGAGGATPEPSASAEASASIAPTAVPAPTPQVYVIVSGDTLSKVAARFGISLPELLAANPSITNANKIAIGDRVVIPTAAPSNVLDSGSPSASPSG